MIATLTLVFCLAGTPCTGHDRVVIEPLSDEDMYIEGGSSACFTHGETLASLWLEEHPKWQFGAVRCAPGRQPRKQAI